MATAVGDVLHAGNVKKSVCLMTGQATITAQPVDGVTTPASGAVPVYLDRTVGLGPKEFALAFQGRSPTECTLFISSTAGSGVMTGTFTLWGYLVATGKWYPIQVNAGAALAELATPGDTIRYTQLYTQLGHYDYLNLQLTAVGGTATAFEAWITNSKPGM